ncbi:VCBS repeat-containing protein [Robiginitalea sediminis]|uniref:VCBS repeat-containing protein n=1 Tax=Robiginitalea sediminis TaxID=1982593 RepID=UPI0013039694|nr:VCBS repeat-containing protein [Robiginitalea sediminis]
MEFLQSISPITIKRVIPFLKGLTLLLISWGCNPGSSDQDPESTTPNQVAPVFERVDPATSGVTFENRITENVATLENLFNYDYFYNGAGVGMADLNNDGLLDLFFCGNQQPNRLYLNKGDMVFEDISEAAGINHGKQWSNGVTFADVNADGWLDIYVSQGGPNQRLQRKNLLFLNGKDGTFTEAAEALGLADMGISTQSAFLDYDGDGDLDCIVMNENEYYGVDPFQLKELIRRNPEAPYFNSSHLYRNDGGTFTDVTREASIERPIFGLGLLVSDINRDGLTDIYIASDYYLPDALFINQGDGTFKDEVQAYTQQISYYGMGIDMADINNDALQDIFVLDMASSDHYRSKTLMASMDTQRFDYLVNQSGYHYQYMYNSLQLNQGGNHYSNIAQFTGAASTDWSWSVLMADYDLDADKDIYVTNGYRRYALDNDLQQRVFAARKQYGDNVPLQVKQELYNSMPSEKLPNLLFENQGDLSFPENGAEWGLGDLTFSNGAALGDLDNDGDPDLVVNNMDETAFIYRNTAREQNLGNYLKVLAKGVHSEAFPSITIYHNGTQQLIEPRRVRGYRSSHEPAAHFGLGADTQVDSLRAEWPDGKVTFLTGIAANQTLTLEASQAVAAGTPSESEPLFEAHNPVAYGLDMAHQENPYDDFATEILLPYKQSNFGPYMASGDVNGDQKDDIYFGGASGQAGSLYLSTTSGFRKANVPAFDSDLTFEDMESVFFDLDSDGDLDLYVVSGGNEFASGSSLYKDRIYLNDGSGRFTRDTREGHQLGSQSGKAVAALDYDQDGDTDLVVGNRILARNYPRHAPSLLLENRDGILVDVTREKLPAFADFGIVNALLPTDFDGDGKTDLIAAGEWTSVGLFRNTGGGFEALDAGQAGIPDKGWWFSVTQTDANGDGRPDYILGNVGRNIKFSASPEKPFKVFATDFDENGTHDIVLSKKYQGEYVPVRGRECSSQQMPFIADKFPTYSEFASASLQEVYGDALANSYEREATGFASVLLLNQGNGRFSRLELPAEAQLIPVMAVVPQDVNQDGLEDLILGGNIYETEVETPRLDALSGLVLLSRGDGRYTPLTQDKTGLYMRGNVKSILPLRMGGDTWLLTGRNNDSPLLWKFRPLRSNLTPALP